MRLFARASVMRVGISLMEKTLRIDLLIFNRVVKFLVKFDIHGLYLREHLKFKLRSTHIYSRHTLK